MKLLTLSTRGPAHAGIYVEFDKFGFVPFTGRDGRVFQVRLDPKLGEPLRSAKAAMTSDYNALVAELNGLANDLGVGRLWEGSSPYANSRQSEKFLWPLFSELAKLGRLKSGYDDHWTSQPFNWSARPAMLFRADTARTASAHAELVPEVDPNDRRLLVRVNAGPGMYKSTVRVRVGERARVIAFGESHGHKQTWDEKMVVVEPGGSIILRLEATTNTQRLSYTRVYRWDGETLTLEQTQQAGHGSGHDPAFQFETTSCTALQVVAEGEAEYGRISARLAELVGQTDDRRIQADILLGRLDTFASARSRLSDRVEALEAAVAGYTGYAADIIRKDDECAHATVLRPEHERADDKFVTSRDYPWTEPDITRLEQDVNAYLLYCRELDRKADEALARERVVEVACTDRHFEDAFLVKVGEDRWVRFGCEKAFKNAMSELRIRPVGEHLFRLVPFPPVERVVVRYLYLNTATAKQERAIGGTISGFARTLPKSTDWNGYRQVDGGLRTASQLPEVVTAFIAVDDEVVWKGKSSQLAEVSQAIAKAWNTPYGQALRALKRQEWIYAAKAVDEGELSLPSVAPQVVFSTARYSTQLRADCLQERLDAKTKALAAALAEVVNTYPSVMLREVTTADRENLLDAGAVITNFGGRVREAGYSHNEAYFVICPDGTLREADLSTEYEKLWKGVMQDELALYHAKGGQHSEHTFEVRHCPEGGLTEAQKAVVNQLQEKIAKVWEGRVTGNGNLSPSMGNGWGLTTPTYRQIRKLAEVAAPAPQAPAEPTKPATLADLMSKFNKR